MEYQSSEEDDETLSSDLVPAKIATKNNEIIGGKYKVESSVKQHAHVQIAKDLELLRKVVIKTVDGNHPLSDNEAKALAKISDLAPNVVKIYHSFTESDCFYMVMEFVGERTLNDLIPVGPKKVMQVIAYLCQVLQGLEFLHAHGWYHCDIKPANIGICDKPIGKTAILLDFGSAYHEKKENVHVTREYMHFDKGTPGFMPPEYQRSPQADIFAFGKTMELLFPNCEQDTRFGQKLRNIITRATENDPKKRYQNAGSLREDLNSLYVWEPNSTLPDWLKLPKYYEKRIKAFNPQHIKSHWYNNSSEMNFDVPEQYRQLYDAIAPRVIEAMASNGNWNGTVFGLRNCIISRTTENEDQLLELYFTQSNYQHFCIMHELLKHITQKQALEANQLTEENTKRIGQLKNLYGTFHEDISMFNTTLGLHITIITNDPEPKLIFTRRTKHVKQFTHISVTCGITETVHVKDQPHTSEPPNIYKTVRRGLEEELGVKLSDDDLDKIKLLGVGARKGDNIWGFVGFVDFSKSNDNAYNWENIKLSMLAAPDSNFEIESFHPIPLDIRSVLQYIKQNSEIMDEGASALAISILYYFFSESAVNDAILEMRH